MYGIKKGIFCISTVVEYKGFWARLNWANYAIFLNFIYPIYVLILRCSKLSQIHLLNPNSVGEKLGSIQRDSAQSLAKPKTRCYMAKPFSGGSREGPPAEHTQGVSRIQFLVGRALWAGSQGYWLSAERLSLPPKTPCLPSHTALSISASHGTHGFSHASNPSDSPLCNLLFYAFR